MPDRERNAEICDTRKSRKTVHGNGQDEVTVSTDGDSVIPTTAAN